jgi:hypothetical protein
VVGVSAVCLVFVLATALLVLGAHGSDSSTSAQRMVDENTHATDAVAAYTTTPQHLKRNLTYQVTPSDCANQCEIAAAAVANGFKAWAISGVSLTASATPAIDPCTGTPNSVSWAPIEGPKSTLAVSTPCFNRKTGEMLGFHVTFNSAQLWSDCLSTTACHPASRNYSIAAVAAHEAGHLYGLGHAPGVASSRLTMSPAASTADYGHATLSCGDRLGINAIYHTHLTCTGLPGD